jgi:hypothetical protein
MRCRARKKRRVPSDLDRTAAYRFATAWGRQAGRLGWIQPGTGSAQPDPGLRLCFLFLFIPDYSNHEMVLCFKSV